MIRMATLCDAKTILHLIEMAQQHLKEQGVPQWQNGYPNQKTIEADILSCHNYVIEDNSGVVGTCMISFDADPNYAVIEGKWISSEPYVVIHRVAIEPNVKGKGLAHQFFDFACLKAKEKGVHYIRIDTHDLNHSMRKCIEKYGFQVCGMITVQDKTPRIAYEKEI